MDDRKLIEMAQAGNHQAFLALLTRYDRQIMSVVYRFTHNLFDREDLYQEIFLHCFKSIKSFRFECKFTTWLYRIALNRCVTYMRKNKPNPDLPQPKNPQIPSLETKERLLSIHRAMKRLSQPQRLCFHLFYAEDWDIHDIAELMHCQTGTVKSHLDRARKKIRADREVAQWNMNEI